jgi:hypothetical protein
VVAFARDIPRKPAAKHECKADDDLGAFQHWRMMVPLGLHG